MSGSRSWLCHAWSLWFETNDWLTISFVFAHVSKDRFELHSYLHFCYTRIQWVRFSFGSCLRLSLCLSLIPLCSKWLTSVSKTRCLGMLLWRGWHSAFGKSCPSLEASVSYTACHLDLWVSRFIFLSSIQHLKILLPEKKSIFKIIVFCFETMSHKFQAGLKCTV